MGLEIDREHFEPEDFRRFDARLARCLEVLDTLLATPGFGVGAASLGAELEVTLVDAQSRPLPLNTEVLRQTLDPRMTFELDRFNLECNLRHADLAGRPFAKLRNELESAHAELTRAATSVGGRIAMIGILPTLGESDLQQHAMTDSARYRALSRSLRTARRGAFQLDIAGDDPLRLACEDVTFEGAATSLQIHLRVNPGEFSRAFNAAQLATAPVLAAAGNSPTFLSHRLWQETRVALFKQAVDTRDANDRREQRQARVGFGSGWIEKSAIELFRQAVNDFPVLLPVTGNEDPDICLRDGGIPLLEEIRLHQGTVWHWNRPVYDPHDGGHVRIELRALPAGPTIEDMLANVAFLVGLTLGVAPTMDELARDFDFEFAERNFYRAAQQGLDAPLHWPKLLGGDERPIPARSLLPRLGETALRGLLDAGVEAQDASPLIARMLARVERGQTGASWQKAALDTLEAEGRTRTEALAAMLERYLEHSASGCPVHEWPLP